MQSPPVPASPLPDKAVPDAYLDELTTLQVRHVDASNGYETGIENAEADFAPTLRSLKDMHDAFSEELGRLLLAHGRQPDGDGSWMTGVHRTVMTFRGLFDDIDEDIIPSLVDSESAMLEQYDAVLGEMPGDSDDRSVVVKQRDALTAEIDRLRSRDT